MSDSVLAHVLGHPPAPGHRLRFIGPGDSRSLGLTELYEQSGRLAVALARLGVRAGDRIGILSANCPEWVLLDLAALRLKAVTAGLEPGKFDPGPALLARYGLKLLFTDRDGHGDGVLPVDEVSKLVASTEPDAAPDPVEYASDEPTTIKFTSGSTGEPKGLAATAGSIDSSLRAAHSMFAHGPGDDVFVFLPLSLLQQRYWIYSALRHGHDVTLSAYETAFSALRQARPTVVMGVPAFYKIAQQRIESRARRAADGPPTTAGLRAAADRLLGDRIRYLWTGSAPAAETVLRFFTDIGVPIFEGYGLNETCIVSKNHPGAHRLGSVGQVVPGKEVLFDENGVISVRSVHPVADRYLYAPEGTSERVFSEPGIVRTGDIGHLDEDGFLYIQGRADDVIVLEDARKIMVRPLEDFMKQSPAIEECVVLCPSRTQLIAVVSPAGDPADEAAIADQLARSNAAFGKDEKIRRVVVAKERFSIENGLLTSQFKPQRKKIQEAVRAQIDDSQGGIHAR
ncbi:AMP-binding protein [Streptomyces sp. NPDC050392]|uniref:AMP-binding protein n=1 Tax=unclassified Streptomyces TaxID=2593676 RepID=UPI003422E38E|nr:AMP-binding protein [Streptomyces sp. NBC_01104]